MGTTAILTIIIQLIKDVVPEDKRKYIPLACVILGIVGCYFIGERKTLKECLEQGATIGLASSGLYQGAKGLLNKKEVDPENLFDDHQ